MSYLEYIKVSRESLLTSPDISDFDNIEIEISNESIKDKVIAIKNFIKKLGTMVKEFFFKMTAWIRTKAIKLMRNFSVSPKTRRISEMFKLNVLTEGILSVVVNQYLNSSILGGTTMLFDEKGNLTNLDPKVFDKLKAIREQALDFDNVLEAHKRYKKSNFLSANLLGIAEYCNVYALERASEVYPYYFNNEMLTKDSEAHKGHAKLNIKVTWDQVFEKSNTIDKFADAAEKFWKNEEAKIKPDLDKVEKEINQSLGNDYVPSTDEVNGRYSLIKGWLRTVQAPYALSIAYIQLLSYLTREFDDMKYMVDENKKVDKLYHISEQGDLEGEMRPRIGGTNVTQHLPPRISFSPEIKLCGYGTPKFFLQNNLFDSTGVKRRYDEEKGLSYLDIYVYEGIPDKDTKYLKQELVDHWVGESHLSKEICVLTPIKVKRLGLYRFYYDAQVTIVPKIGGEIKFDANMIKYAEKISD